MTLLPLTDPYWQKTCLDCGLEYVDEYKYPEMRIRLTSDPRKLLTRDITETDNIRLRSPAGDVQYLHLANAIFDTFDRCPFCEGYFTG